MLNTFEVNRPVENPIPKAKLFASPTLEQIQEQIDRLPNAQERATASMVFMLTMNACHDLVENEILSKELFGV